MVAIVVFLIDKKENSNRINNRLKGC